MRAAARGDGRGDGVAPAARADDCTALAAAFGARGGARRAAVGRACDGGGGGGGARLRRRAGRSTARVRAASRTGRRTARAQAEARVTRGQRRSVVRRCLPHWPHADRYRIAPGVVPAPGRGLGGWECSECRPTCQWLPRGRLPTAPRQSGSSRLGCLCIRAPAFRRRRHLRGQGAPRR